MAGYFEFISVCDLNLEKAEEARKRFGFEKATTDWRKLIYDPAVQYISICLFPDLNYEIVMEAAKLKKPIWVEKPIDWNLRRGMVMVEECEKHGTPVAVGQNYRYSDTALTMKKLISQGDIGEPFLCNLEHSFRSDNIFLDWIARSGRYLSAGVCVHYYDLFRYYLDDDADTVFAYMFQAPYRRKQAEELGLPANTCDTSCVASVRFKKGALVQFTCSEDVNGGDIFWQERYTIAGTEGTIFVDKSERFPLQIYRNQSKTREPVLVQAGTAADPGKASVENRRLIEEYLMSIRQGVPSPTCGKDHLKSLAIAEATHISTKTGMPVKVDELLNGNCRR